MAPSFRPPLARCLLSFASLVAIGCSAPVVTPPDGGRCSRVATWPEAKRAVAALELVPFAQTAMYDVGKGTETIPFAVGPVTTAAKSVITFADPNRFSGAPGGFERLANRSYTYDNALYALWATQQGDKTVAAAVLETLAALQRKDGAWGFSFDARGGTFYNAGYVRTGVVAWTTLAFARFTTRFGDNRFKQTLRKAVDWLGSQVQPQWGLLRGGRGRWLDNGRAFDPDYAPDWASTEHNVDAYFALAASEKAGISGKSHTELAASISTGLYIAGQRRYAQGRQPKGLDTVSALDAAGTWSALFEVAMKRRERAAAALAWVEAKHRTNDGGWFGYRPYEHGPDVWFVEGSLAVALADHRLGHTEKARHLTAEVAKLSCMARRPVLYSTRWAPDFPATPAAAPTLWFALVAAEVDGGAPPFLWHRKP